MLEPSFVGSYSSVPGGLATILMNHALASMMRKLATDSQLASPSTVPMLWPTRLGTIATWRNGRQC